MKDNSQTLTLTVNVPNNPYNITIGQGLLEKAAEYIPQKYLKGKIAVITDSNVGPLYSQKIISAFGNDKAKVFTVPAGEQSKSADCLFKLYSDLLEFKITRTDLIIALGGGVVGDLTGFAAATLLRGIPYVQIPTTLLAQVDSSVGGKTAINLPQGKNLVGTFNQPKSVIIDTLCLSTLSRRTLSDGMAEVIKYGAIQDADLFTKLEGFDLNNILDNIIPVIHTCCAIKGRIVEEDEKDTGLRMILNFGHTFGHAIEKHYNFETYSHGMAVAAGMVMACNCGESKGITQKGTAKRMCDILKKYDLPTTATLPNDALSSAASVDKKGDGNLINLILIEEIGKHKICKMQKDEITI